MDDLEGMPLRTSPAVDAGGIFLVLATICVFVLPILIYFPPLPPSVSEALLQTHSPLGLAPAKSSRQSRRAKATTSWPGQQQQQQQPPNPAKICGLWIYPVKSCRGIELSQSKVLPTGLEFDRLYTFAQLKSSPSSGPNSGNNAKALDRWEFVTQRQLPLLATVEVDLYVPDIAKTKSQPPGASSSNDKNTGAGDAYIVVRFPWQDPGILGALGWLNAKLVRGFRATPLKEFVLPVEFPSHKEIQQRGYSFDEVTVWKEQVTALNMEAELPREIRLYLGVKSTRLGIFRIDPARLRNVYRCAPTEFEAGYQPAIGFQDAVSTYFPFPDPF